MAKLLTANGKLEREYNLLSISHVTDHGNDVVIELPYLTQGGGVESVTLVLSHSEALQLAARIVNRVSEKVGK